MADYVRLLSSPAIRHQGAWLEPPAGKTSALLYYLAHKQSWIARDELTHLFWPEVLESRARSNLRKLLSRSIKDLPFSTEIEIEATRVRWQVACDSNEFLQAVQREERARAIELYQGDLMEGFRLAGESEFEDWLSSERQELHDTWREVVLTYAFELEDSSLYLEAANLLERLYLSDTLDEETLRHYLHTLHLAGQRARALSAFQSFAQELEEEFGTEPEEDTLQLIETIRQGLSSDMAPTPLPPPLPEKRLSASPPPAQKPLHYNLPVSPTGFVGRDQEKKRIGELYNDPACRLLTLIGPGGIGKTRLALEVVKQQFEVFSGNVAFVPFTTVPTYEAMPYAIAEALGISFSGEEDPREQLFAHLQDKRLLIVLDNLEHLLSGAELVREILERAPEVKLLVTSRERLNLQPEWVVNLEGLHYPEQMASENSLEYDAVQLFRQHAEKNDSDFTLDRNTIAAMVRITQLVEGLPLAIELAASWLRVLTPRDIAREIETGIDFLEASARDIPERHHSIRAVFDTSWRLLSAEEQAALRGLVVFRGGFGREAAFQVSGVTLPVLVGLTDKSFLHPTPQGRYRRHPLLYQYTKEKLAEHPEEQKRAQAKHAAYFLDLAERAEPQLTGAEQQTWLNSLEEENDNLRAVLRWSRNEETVVETGLRLAAAIWRFWVVRGHMREGRDHLTTLLASPQAQQVGRPRAKALNALGTLLYETGEWPEARSLIAESLDIWRELEDQQEIATILNNLAWADVNLSDYRVAKALSQEALELNRKLGQERGVAVSLNNLGWIAVYEGNFREAVELFESCLTLRENQANPRGIAYALINLAWAKRFTGEHREATPMVDRAENILRQLGDDQMLGWALYMRGVIAADAGDTDTGARLLEGYLELSRKTASKLGLKYGLADLADIMRERGELERATELLTEHISICREGRDRKYYSGGLNSLARLVYDKGDTRRAWTLYRESLEIKHELGDRYGIIKCLEGLARVYTRQSYPARAVQLSASAERFREVVGAPLPERDLSEYRAFLEKLRSLLGDAAFEQAWSKGTSLTLEQAVAHALSEDEIFTPPEGEG
ncbi:MAG: tetratricopeptide repeat protein [Trueperaceae bacterium]|nr:MAG: tetratricopeptide repeat protein [Trueperaceae bacterium]